MSKTNQIRIILGLALALAFPASAHAGDAYPTITFAFPIIDQRIVDALSDPTTNQSITITPYVYGGGNDEPVGDDSAVELRGYHLIYFSQSDPNSILDLNDPEVKRSLEFMGPLPVLVFWDGFGDFFGEDIHDNLNVGFAVSPPVEADVPESLRSDLTNIGSEQSDLPIQYYLGADSLQDWINFVDDFLSENPTLFQNNTNYLDVHRQIGTYEGEFESASPLVDSYFRVYRTGYFHDAPQAPAPVRQTTNLKFDGSFFGTDKLADPKGEMRAMLDAIDAKYGKLIKS
jgi:hypothetical protein